MRIDLAHVQNVVAVPLEAVDGSGSDQRVFVVDSAGVIHIRKAIIGLQSPQYVQVLSGVQPGDVVIVGRHSDYYDGERVKAHFETPNATLTAHS